MHFFFFFFFSQPGCEYIYYTFVTFPLDKAGFVLHYFTELGSFLDGGAEVVFCGQ